MSGASRRAASQMRRDGIRTLRPNQRCGQMCGHAVFQDKMITVMCRNGARYSTRWGLRCSTHARVKPNA